MKQNGLQNYTINILYSNKILKSFIHSGWFGIIPRIGEKLKVQNNLLEISEIIWNIDDQKIDIYCNDIVGLTIPDFSKTESTNLQNIIDNLSKTSTLEELLGLNINKTDENKKNN